ncbi:MAG: S9 family peptidase [Chthoniobacterales bacterium]
MIKSFFALILLSTLVSPWAMSQTPAVKNLPPLIPLRDFFRNPEISSYQLSPDGKHLAFKRPYERRMNIFVRPTDGDTETRLTSEKERDIAGYIWKGNDTILYLKDFGGDENFHLFKVSLKGGEAVDLTPFEGVRAELVDELKDDDGALLVSLNKRNREIFDVYRLNVKTGELKMVAENPGGITGWVTDHHGRIRAAVQTDGVNNTLLAREKEDGEFKKVLTTNFRETISPEFFTFDDKNLYVISNVGRDKAAAAILDLKTGKEIKTIYENPEVDVSSLSYSQKNKVLWTALYTTWKTERHFFDEGIKKIFTRLKEKLPGYEVGIVNTDKAEDMFVVRTYSDRSLGAYYLYNATTDKLQTLSELSPWLKEDELCEMKPVEYKSRDGLTIHAYLTLPKGVDAKNLPVVVNVHGGPWVRDDWGFDPEVQFLANRGYAVLQPNYRGSTGYGRKFWESSFKQWGKTMQNDVTDGAEWLIKEGIADPKRVGIYGGSYGGYAVLSGLTVTPDLYACGVDYVGVSNLLTFLNTIPPYWKPYLDMMHEMVGNPMTEKALLEAASPVLHADRIKAPLLIAQGAKDPRVNIDESNQMVAALKKRGVDVPYIVKENEGHGFHNEENRFDFYGAMEAFLAKYLGGRTTAPAK